MDDRKLQGLLCVLRAGSFSAAAAELCCTQSAVTQMMNSLEAELGGKILLRSHSGVKLTPAGEELLPYIVEANTGLTRLMEHAALIAQGRAVPIRLGAFASVAKTMLPPAIKEYQKNNPDVTFDIRIGTSQLPALLSTGEIDLALGDDDRLSGFRWYPLADYPFYAVLPKNMVKAGKTFITQAEFTQLPFIMAGMNELKSRLTVQPTRQIKVDCDDDTALLSMVAEGLGVTVLPEMSLMSIPDGVALLELEPPIKRTIGAALPDDPSKPAMDFLRFLQKRADLKK